MPLPGFQAAPITAPPQSVRRFGLASNGGTLQSFSDALNAKLLSDDDYAAFVDPGVVGTDRALAIRLLELMPPGMRGDFLYVDGKHVVSNRLSLAGGVRFARPGDPQQLLRGLDSNVRHEQSYPPLGGSGGPYLRHYSAQGVNAGYGYATVPCDSAFAGSDNGFMYFNAYTADSSGSVVDAGLAIGYGVGGTIQAHPFINNQGTYTRDGQTRTTPGHAIPISA